jgi:sugar lactone lactonase YvrE
MTRSAFVVLLLLGGVAADAGDGGIRLKQSAVIGQDSWLLALHGLAVLPDGGVLVSDKLDYRIKRFTAGGKRSATLGGRGKGPGQFQGPGPIDSRGRYVAVAEFARGRIQYFDTALSPLCSFDVPGAVSDLCLDPAGNLWVMAVTLDPSRGLLQYDREGHLEKALPLRNARGDLFLDAGFVCWAGGGVVAVGYFIQNRIELWDTGGVFLRQFSVPGLPDRVPVDQVKVEGRSDGILVPRGSLLRSMASDGRGTLYCLEADYGDQPGRGIVVVDLRGRRLARLELPEKAMLIRVDRKGEIFAVPGKRNSVIRYGRARK